jgi:hypothetical protein
MAVADRDHRAAGRAAPRRADLPLQRARLVHRSRRRARQDAPPRFGRLPPAVRAPALYARADRRLEVTKPRERGASW